jgi:hypothetical protein
VCIVGSPRGHRSANLSFLSRVVAVPLNRLSEVVLTGSCLLEVAKRDELECLWEDVVATFRELFVEVTETCSRALLTVELVDIAEVGRGILCDGGKDVPLISRYLRIVGLNGAVNLNVTVNKTWHLQENYLRGDSFWQENFICVK